MIWAADSLDLVELSMSMEEEFDIDISMEDAEKLLTVRDAIDYINRINAQRYRYYLNKTCRRSE